MEHPNQVEAAEAEIVDTGATKSKRYILTCNNPPALISLPSFFDPAEMDYMAGQFETAPTTGTRHFHLYIVWKVRKGVATVKKWCSNHGLPTTNVLVARGNEKQCRDYVTKAESRLLGPWEMGTFDPNRGIQGKRKDLEEIRDKLMNKTPMQQIAQEHPADFLRYHSGLYEMQTLLTPTPPTRREVRVITLWGPTGVGKTHRILTKFPEVYSVEPGRDPWSAYKGEEMILFDEFDETKWSIQQMNRLLDVWRLKLDARYHDKYAAWNTVFLCLNSDPEELWINETNGKLRDSYKRRLGLLPGGNGIVFHIDSRDTPCDLEELVGPFPQPDSPAQAAPAPQAAPAALASPVPVPAPAAHAHFLHWTPPAVHVVNDEDSCMSSPSPPPPPPAKLRRTESVILQRP